MIPIPYVGAAFGGLLKIYDDIVDIPEYANYSSPRILEIIKVLIISTLTYISIHNVNIPFIIFIFHLIHVIFVDKKALDTDFYFSGMVLSFILIFVALTSSELNFGAIPIIIASVLSLAFDHYFFPEEHSWKKIIERCIFAGCLIFSPQIVPAVSNMINFDLNTWMDYDVASIAAGYFCISIINMTYLEITSKKIKPVDEHVE
jgi:hypothetical protein